MIGSGQNKWIENISSTVTITIKKLINFSILDIFDSRQLSINFQPHTK